ncbi:MAG: DUF1735 domain-containing protein, partial [Alistipes sp.]|nr:DUF1735 domain-containing protein [Alistipes sp.]
MKNKIIFALVLVLTVAAGCNDASYDIIDNGLYLKEAQDAKGLMSRKITVDDQSVELTLTPALSAPMDADVWVTFSLDAEILTAYNQANESDYELLPSSLYQMGEGVTIHAGSVSGDAVRVVVEPFQAEDGVMYALPITVSSTQVNALPTSSKYIILLDKPLIQSVHYIEYRSHLLCEQLNTDGTMTG